MPEVIETDQAPAARPVGVSRRLFEEDQAYTLVEPPKYNVPITGFAGGRRDADAVAEITSPLILANVTNFDDVEVSVWIERPGVNSYVAWRWQVPTRDALRIQLQGQFLTTGDRLMVEADRGGAIEATLSYTVGEREEQDVQVS